MKKSHAPGNGHHADQSAYACDDRHQRAGVATLRVAPDGQTLHERVTILGQLIDLVNEVNAETNEGLPYF
jgi:hypothetical protein